MRTTPAAGISRDGDDAIVRVEVPGTDPENDVAVELTGRQLIIRDGAFRRSFGVPRHVHADAITAIYDDGVLSVRLAGAYAADELAA
jgi:HSP20 family protein